ncbi:hypothetical protein HMSSN036_25280 [Paenibacillus macerans]|uniref:hypothetical protein n=1 Tax=Paenibacillus sp. FSL R5-0527 TaxID=2975321 RepID=UPI00097A46C8|nr:hypothetical protein BK140_06885 [Paenibacillus macerans]GJM70312.1 hypothetical protein HMSSN036_25280 [Paenibacillus macerans]
MNKIHKIIGSVALAAMLVSGLPDTSAHAASAVTIQNVDQALIEAAQNKLKEITGNTYSFSKAEAFGNDVSLEIEGNSYSQVIVDAEGTVKIISVQFEYKDLQNAKFKNELKAAWKKAFPKNNEELDIVIVNYTDTEGLKVNTGNDAGTVYLTNGKLEYSTVDVKEKDVPQPVKAAADAALTKIGGLKKKARSVSGMTIKPNQKPVYNLAYTTDKGNVWIDVEQGTNRIMTVNAMALSDQLHKKDTKDREAIENKIKSYTVDQLLKTAAKQAKSIMNLDLSGYAAEKVKGNEDTVMFTKKGAPKVQGKFNSKGQFYYFEVM